MFWKSDTIPAMKYLVHLIKAVIACYTEEPTLEERKQIQEDLTNYSF